MGRKLPPRHAVVIAAHGSPAWLGSYLELGSDVILTPAEMFASTPSIVGPPGPGVPGFLARAAATR